MSNAELTKYWFDSAEKDWGVAQLLFASKKYMHCLFFGHITLEKILKGIITKKGKEVPLKHDLVLLAEQAEINLTTEQAELLSEINAFNIRARYDNFKNSFYKRATLAYTKKYIDSIKNLRLWLKKQ